MSSFDFSMKAVLLAGLNAEDSADLANFTCGDEELNRFLREEALNEQEQKLREDVAQSRASGRARAKYPNRCSFDIYSATWYSKLEVDRKDRIS